MRVTRLSCRTPLRVTSPWAPRFFYERRSGRRRDCANNVATILHRWTFRRPDKAQCLITQQALGSAFPDGSFERMIWRVAKKSDESS